MIVCVFTNPAYKEKNNTKCIKIIVTINKSKDLYAFGVSKNINLNQLTYPRYYNDFDIKDIIHSNTCMNGIAGIENGWKELSNNDKENIYHFINVHLRSSFLVFFNSNKRHNLSCKEKTFILNALNEYEEVVSNLYHNQPVKYNVSNKTSFDMIDKNITEENKPDLRKSITMFKIINANNLNSLLAGNFYPIVREDGDYCIIKDKDNEYTVRNNRGIKINVFIEKPI